MKNKTKTVIAIILGVITAIAGLTASGEVPLAAYAQSAETPESAIANRNEVNVSVGDKTVKIVAYNIDGYNYFRAADVCQALNMKVFQYLTDLGDGIKIVSNEAFEGSVEAPPAEINLAVTVKDINVFYDGGYVKAKCFNFGGRNYIKLADIVAAANNNYEIKLESVQKHAKNGTGQAITTRPITIDLKTGFDSGTNTITIATTKTDFQKLYEDLYTKEQGKAPIETTQVETQPKAIAQPELTQAPEVGTILAKILIDPTKSAYIDGIPNNGVDWGNITAPYSSPYSGGVMGGCVWYAEGRLAEVTGVPYPYNTSTYDLTGISKNPDFQVITESNKIVARSIAVFGDVHVLFIEYVERDAQGNPNFIYFTEGNTGRDGIYRPEQDGKVQKLEFNKFINRQSAYKGCIAIK